MNNITKKLLLCVLLTIMSFNILITTTSATEANNIIKESNLKEVTITWDELNKINADPKTIYCVIDVPHFNEYESENNDILNPITRGDGVPGASWNVITSGKYNIDGTKTNSDYFYTSYCFTGTNSYKLSLKNTGSSALKFDVMKKNLLFDSVIMTQTINPGVTTDICSSFDLTSSDKWYVRFYGPCKMSGFADKW